MRSETTVSTYSLIAATDNHPNAHRAAVAGHPHPPVVNPAVQLAAGAVFLEEGVEGGEQFGHLLFWLGPEEMLGEDPGSESWHL